MSKRFLKTIVFAIALSFVVLALASALPNNTAVSSSKEASSASGQPISFAAVHSKAQGYVKNTLFLANNTLVSGNSNPSPNGVGLQSVIYVPSNNELYATTLNTQGPGSNSVIYVLNGTTGKVIDTIEAGQATQSLTFDPSNGHIYAINRDSDSVSIINTSTNEVTGSVKVGYYPMYAAYDNATGNLYVSNSFDNNVSIISTQTNTVIGSLPVGNTPNGLAFDSANGYIYVTNNGGSNITVINGSSNKVFGSITTGSYPSEAAYDPTNGYIYVANNGGSNITVINGSSNTAIGSITVQNNPDAIAFDSSNGYIYVTSDYSSTVSAVDPNTNTVVSTVPVGNDPEGLAVGAPGVYIYVSSLNAGEFAGISFINSTTNTFFKTVYTIASPTSLTFNPINDKLYAGNYYPYDISVLNTTSNIVDKTMNLGYSPVSTTINPLNGTIYSLNSDPSQSNYDGNLTAINGSTGKIMGSTYIPNPPRGMSFDPSNGHIYVTAYFYPEAILYTINATSGAIVSQSSYYSPNGSYGTPIYNPANGNVYVYNSTDQQFLIINSTTNSISQTSTPGGYPYPYSGTFDPHNGYLYLSTQYGEEVMNATTNSIVTFLNVGNNPISSALDLSNGYIYVANEYSNNVSVIDGTTNTVLGNITVGYQPDAVAYSTSNGDVYVANYASGTISIIPTVFYNVTFTQTGLPTGTTWYVNLSNGQNLTSTGPTLSFSEANGTYSYTVGLSGNIYSASNASGSFTVHGGNVSNSVSFSKVVYSVDFTESGLPAGTTWYVNLSNGQQFHSQSSTVTFSEANGTYSYTLSAGNDSYVASPHSGTFAVNGGKLAENAVFKKASYTVKFAETGLPTGTTWYVNLSNGQSFSSSNSTVEFNETDGAYTYTVNATGFGASISNGTLDVNGANLTESVNFTASHNKPASPGIPATVWYGIAGVFVAAGIAGTAFILFRRNKLFFHFFILTIFLFF